MKTKSAAARVAVVYSTGVNGSVPYLADWYYDTVMHRMTGRIEHDRNNHSLRMFAKPGFESGAEILFTLSTHYG